MGRVLITLLITLHFFLIDSSFSLAYEKEMGRISSAIAESIAKSGKKTIAVVDFTDLQGNVTELGRFLAEEFSVTLAGAGKGFEVVDRTHLKSILAEHKLSATGMIDPQTAKKLGQIAGVGAIITGSVTPFGDSVRISVKVLATDTAKIIGASSGDIAKTKAIEELLARGIESAQPINLRTPTISHVPSSSSPISKKVGNITVTVKKMLVSKNQVTVMLDFINHSGKELQLAYVTSQPDPSLQDERGNAFVYSSGIPYNAFSKYWKESSLTLNPKSNNDVSLIFGHRVPIKEIGTLFTLSLNYAIYDKNDTLHYNVSFADIKAQLPK